MIPVAIAETDPSRRVPYKGYSDFFPEALNLRATLNNMNDLMDLRLRIGGRLMADLRSRLGLKPSESEDDMDPEGKKLLTRLRVEYQRITDSVASPRGIRSIDHFQRVYGKVLEEKRLEKAPDDGLPPLILTDYAQYFMITSYEQTLRSEMTIEGVLDDLLDQHKIWNDFLVYVKGIGPRMGGTLVAYLDPFYSFYGSSFISYAGLDTVPVKEPEKALAELLEQGRKTWGLEVVMHQGELPYGTPPTFKEADDQSSLRKSKGRGTDDSYAVKQWRNKVTSLLLNAREGRSRRADHLVERAYTTRTGEEATKLSTTYNPDFKTKIRGVMAPGFLRSSSQYRELYDNYKSRILNMPVHADKTPKHINNMCLRYMTKGFLYDLHEVWRRMYGLPVLPRYEEAKLGMVHTKDPLWKSIVPEDVQNEWPKEFSLG